MYVICTKSRNNLTNLNNFIILYVYLKRKLLLIIQSFGILHMYI